MNRFKVTDGSIKSNDKLKNIFNSINIPNYLGRIRKLKKKYGIKVVISKSLLFLLSPLISVRTIYKLNLNEVDWNKFEDGRFNFSKMSIADLSKLVKEYSVEISMNRFRTLKNIINGDYSECYKVVNHNNDVCSYNCVAFKKPELEKIFSKIKNLNINKNAYIFREYTFKRFRNQGVQTFAYYKRFKILNEKGFKTVVARVAKYNSAAEHICQKLGFKGELREIHFHFFNIFKNSNFIVFKI